jgi:hypothetical protein
MPVGNMWMSSTFLLFDSQWDFRWNNTRFESFDCCSQSRPKRCHYQILLLGCDVVGLSVATHYGPFKCYAPTRNLITTIESSLWWFLVVIRFPSKILNQIALLTDFSSLLNPVWESLTPLDATSSLRKIVVSLPWNLSCCPLVRNLANLSFQPSLSKVGCR